MSRQQKHFFKVEFISLKISDFFLLLLLFYFQSALINFRRRSITQRLMWSFIVVKTKIIFQAVRRFPSVPIIFQINFFVFHASPQSLDHNIVKTSAASIHTYRYFITLQHFEPPDSRKLAALIGIKYLRLCRPADGSLQTIDKTARFQRIRDFNARSRISNTNPLSLTNIRIHRAFRYM